MFFPRGLNFAIILKSRKSRKLTLAKISKKKVLKMDTSFSLLKLMHMSATQKCLIYVINKIYQLEVDKGK